MKRNKVLIFLAICFALSSCKEDKPENTSSDSGSVARGAVSPTEQRSDVAKKVSRINTSISEKFDSPETFIAKFCISTQINQGLTGWSTDCLEGETANVVGNTISINESEKGLSGNLICKNKDCSESSASIIGLGGSSLEILFESKVIGECESNCLIDVLHDLPSIYRRSLKGDELSSESYQVKVARAKLYLIQVPGGSSLYTLVTETTHEAESESKVELKWSSVASQAKPQYYNFFKRNQWTEGGWGHLQLEAESKLSGVGGDEIVVQITFKNWYDGRSSDDGARGRFKTGSSMALKLKNKIREVYSL